MEITIGKEGLSKSWQAEFPPETECCQCGAGARIGFVAHEGLDGENPERYVTNLHLNGGRGGCWLHDCCAVAIYFCRECLKPTALYNQA